MLSCNNLPGTLVSGLVSTQICSQFPISIKRIGDFPDSASLALTHDNLNTSSDYVYSNQYYTSVFPDLRSGDILIAVVDMRSEKDKERESETEEDRELEKEVEGELKMEKKWESENDCGRTLAFSLQAKEVPVYVYGIPESVVFGFTLLGKITLSDLTLQRQESTKNFSQAINIGETWTGHLWRSPVRGPLIKVPLKIAQAKETQNTDSQNSTATSTSLQNSSTPKSKISSELCPIIEGEDSYFSVIPTESPFAFSFHNKNTSISTAVVNFPISNGVYALKIQVVKVPKDRRWSISVGILDYVHVKDNPTPSKRITQPGTAGITYSSNFNECAVRSGDYSYVNSLFGIDLYLSKRKVVCAELCMDSRTLSFTLDGSSIPSYVYLLPETVVFGFSLQDRMTVSLLSIKKLKSNSLSSKNISINEHISERVEYNK